MARNKEKSELTLFKRVSNRILAWSSHKHAIYYLGGLTISEAVFFPLPPDVMLAPMVLARPKAVWRLACFVTLMSVLGGVLGYAVGFYAFEIVGAPFVTTLGLEDVYQKVAAWFEHYGFVTILVAGVTPIPYKVFTLAAGASQMAIIPFIFGALLGRSVRFYLVAGCMRYFGQSITLSKKQILAFCLVLMTLMMGCSSPRTVAPVEALSLDPITSGYHDVAWGDTIYSIAWRYDRDYHEIAALNHLDSPYRLQVGQRLSLGDGSISRSNIFTSTNNLDTSSQPSTSLVREYVGEEKQPSLQKAEQVEPLPKPQVQSQPIQKALVTGMTAKPGKWRWPADGKLVGRFAKGPRVNKGIDIQNQAGTSVHATASGHVVYAGNGLRGYGNLIIIKHNEEYLSAYAHNDVLLVKEGEHVQQGRMIAKMGHSGTDTTKLHFEIRYRGQPVDPLKYLPTLNA